MSGRKEPTVPAFARTDHECPRCRYQTVVRLPEVEVPVGAVQLFCFRCNYAFLYPTRHHGDWWPLSKDERVLLLGEARRALQ